MGRWSVGQKVTALYWWNRTEGHYIVIERVTSTRAYAEGMCWDAKGEPFGEPRHGAYSNVPRWPCIREVQDGDDALDAMWRAAREAERRQKEHEHKARTLASTHARGWSRLTEEQMDTILGWLEAQDG